MIFFYVFSKKRKFLYKKGQKIPDSRLMVRKAKIGGNGEEEKIRQETV